MASSASSSDRRVNAAASRGVGDRPRSVARWSTASPMLMARSWRSRGTRMAQPLSRKWRLSSPVMVGTAKRGNGPAAGS